VNPGFGRAAAPRGFTLLEVLMVVALIAIAAGAVSLALRDSTGQKLEEEAARLSALLESARARSRTLGQELRWQPATDSAAFHFTPVLEGVQLPSRWLDERTRAEVVGAPALILGPEPLIEPQQVLLRLDDQRLLLATDGMGPFVRQELPAAETRP
jgi:general secretion pathway protein H